jgi:hypothetical protein
MPSIEDCNDRDVEYLVKSESWVTQHAFNNQIKKNDVEQQRKNIFHMRCHISNKICSIIIDNESCANVVSTILVRKLNWTIKLHKPYRVQWLNEYDDVNVTKKVSVSFLTGKCSDKVLRDVVFMHVRHLLLGRPW